MTSGTCVMQAHGSPRSGSALVGTLLRHCELLLLRQVDSVPASIAAPSAPSSPARKDDTPFGTPFMQCVCT